MTYYIGREAVESTLDFVAGSSGIGSSIVFDYIFSSALSEECRRQDAVRFKERAASHGEPLLFGIEEGGIAPFLSRWGFRSVNAANSEKLRELYFSDKDREANISPIFEIVHATK